MQKAGDGGALQPVQLIQKQAMGGAPNDANAGNGTPIYLVLCRTGHEVPKNAKAANEPLSIISSDQRVFTHSD